MKVQLLLTGVLGGGRCEVQFLGCDKTASYAFIAQLVECYLGKVEVSSSNLLESSIYAFIAQLVRATDS